MSTNQIASWIVPITGHQFDLEDLPLWLAGQDVRVLERDGSFVLLIPVAIVGNDAEPVRPFAERHLEVLNGIGRVLNPSFRPLTLANDLFGMDSAGIVVRTVVSTGTAEMRVKAGVLRMVVGGIAQPDPRKALASPLLIAAARSPQARDALVIVGRPEPTWPELYVLFELVKANMGDKAFDLGWISRKDAGLFSRTVNSYSTLRSAGRHGKDGGAPPAQPMPFHVAVTLVRNLVLAWLRHVGRPLVASHTCHPLHAERTTPEGMPSHPSDLIRFFGPGLSEESLCPVTSMFAALPARSE